MTAPAHGIGVELVADGLPDEVFLVSELNLTEGLNLPYELRVQATTSSFGIVPEDLLGRPATVVLTRGEGSRAIMGIVAAVAEVPPPAEDQRSVDFVVRPALEALRHRVDTRIFQEMSVPEILAEVLGEGLGAYDRSFEDRTSRGYPPCDYRVQFDESDLDFCHRLMEEEGITYWFEMDGDAELLVLADHASAFGTVPTIDDGPIPVTRDRSEARQEVIRSFTVASRLRPTKVKTRHYHWSTPAVTYEAESDEVPPIDFPSGAAVKGPREVYEHDRHPLTIAPGGTSYGADEDDQIRIRRERHAYDARVATGRSTVLGMSAGATFELAGHPRADLDGEWLVVGVTHRLTAEAFAYTNEVQAIPKEVPYRPPRLTIKPRMPSVQTATVVGPAGEEIHTDAHGRIKVQFHWDRLGAMDEKASCWLRVRQPWAGAGWGFSFIPRIGMEVVVDFLDGDPDRPIALGCVYNGDHPPPYELPADKTKSTIKTSSSLGGDGFNEWRFEDLAGSEEIYTHAQKDQNEVVENDHTTTVHHDQVIRVDHDQTQDIGNDQTEHVFHDQDLTVDANRTITVHGDFTETVDGSETRTVSSGSEETIDGGETRTVTGGLSETISGGREQTIDGGSTETITGSLDQTITGGASISTDGAFELTAVGGVTIKAPAGTTFRTNTTTILAPGGNVHHDSFWELLVLKWHDNFAIKLDVTPVVMHFQALFLIQNMFFLVQNRGAVLNVSLTWSPQPHLDKDVQGVDAHLKAADAQGTGGNAE